MTTDFAVGGELFDLSTMVTGPTLGVPYSSLSYAIASADASLFDINTSTGKIKLFSISSDRDVIKWTFL